MNGSLVLRSCGPWRLPLLWCCLLAASAALAGPAAAVAEEGTGAPAQKSTGPARSGGTTPDEKRSNGPSGAKRPDSGQSRSLFDGKRLGKWKVATEFTFKRHGNVEVADGKLLLRQGEPATGVRWTGKFPTVDYEVTLEAMRTGGDDFFCGMTFPVGKLALTLIIGGWGGTATGLSSIDDEPAVENETAGYMQFKQNHWYRIRLRVSGQKVEAWVDKQPIVDFAYPDRKLSLYWEMEPCLPLGICTWRTSAALRNIRLRRLAPQPKKPHARN